MLRHVKIFAEINYVVAVNTKLSFRVMKGVHIKLFNNIDEFIAKTK